MFGSISPFRKKEFVLTIGDEGAVLLYLENGLVRKRLFAASPSEAVAFSKLIMSDNSVPIYLFVDTMEQNYELQALPPVGRFAIKSIIKRKMESHDQNEIQGIHPIGRSKDERKEWLYLFITLSEITPFSDWMDFIGQFENIFKGIYLLPLETTLLIKDFKKRHNNKSRWQILVSHNKVGGFRQVILRDENLLFTRLTQPLAEQNPEIIAGNIEQETRNTIEYLKRFSLRDDEAVDMYFICAEEIKKSLDLEQFELHNIISFTPYEAALKLDMEQAVGKDDKFGDVLLSTYFIKSKKHLLEVFNDTSRKLKKLYDISFYAKVATFIAAPIILASTLYLSNNIYNIYKDISFEEKEKKIAEDNYQKSLDEARKIPMDINIVSDVIYLYETISEGVSSPLPLVAKFGEIASGKALVYSISWSASDIIEVRKTNGIIFENATFKIRLLEKSRELNKITIASDDFVKAMKKWMPNYTVKPARLPGVFQDQETWKQTIGNEKDMTERLAEQLRNLEIIISGYTNAGS